VQRRRSTTVRVLLIAGCLGAFAIPSLAAPRPKPSAACDQACLTGFMDQYLAALEKHDPSGLPVASSAKMTENTKPIRLREGVWKTMKYMQFQGETISDPTTGEVVYFGAIREDFVSPLVVRLKIADRKITEIETIVAHGTDPKMPPQDGFEVTPDLQLLAAIKPFLEDVVPASKRSSRSQMIADANAYFDGIEHQPGHVPFAPDCNRIENGQLTTNNPTNTEGLPPLGCQQQFQAKLFTYIPRIRDRRFPVVDEARGLVVAMGVFDIPGSKTWLRDGKEVPAPPAIKNPRNNLFNEIFKIEGGKIRLIQAFNLADEPYGTQTGWR
jgi:hypothetical protein